MQGLAGRLTRRAEAGGSNVSPAALRVRMRGGARPDKALLHRTKHCFKVSLCRADRSIGEITMKARAVSPAGWKACALIDAVPAHHYRKRGLWFWG